MPVADDSQIGECRRVLSRLGEVQGFTAEVQGRLAIIATEMATNLLRHARHGTVVAQPVRLLSGKPAVEVLAIDSGPGIQDVNEALRDGFSTAGTSGNGLGAIRRLSNEFDLYSRPGNGTVVYARVAESDHHAPTAPRQTPQHVWSGLCIPQKNQLVCGDDWQFIEQGGYFSLMVIDGLGHGEEAAKATRPAIQFHSEHPDVSPGEVLQRIQSPMASTRGAAAAVTILGRDQKELIYAGIGNISGVLFHRMERRSLFSHNGIVGGPIRKVQEFTYSVQTGDLLIMHSDGLQTHWSLDPYPGLMMRHPAVLAGVLYRDFQRGRDDLTVVVLRLGKLLESSPALTP